MRSSAQFKTALSIDVERIDAVDARKNYQACLDEAKLNFSPFTISMGLYFYYSPAAFGCSLSHYKIWKKMVNEKIPYAMIVEDDVSINSLFSFLSQQNTNYKNFDLIQLTQRAVKRDQYTFFHGSESYILSLTGAQKLVEVTNNPSLLSDINDYEESLSINQYYFNHKLPIPKADVNRMPKNSIIAPSDQIFSLCTHLKCAEAGRLSFDVQSCIELDYNYSKFTNISPAVQAWKAKEEHIKEYLNSSQYKQNFISSIC
jgi:GR25 family glycosyltransferase involved in LPS biosynthesis